MSDLLLGPYKDIEVIGEVAEVGITISSLAKCSIQRIRSDQFIFDTNMELISEIFQIDCADTKPVPVKMQHCANIPADDKNASKKLKFMICSNPNFEGPHNFTSCEGCFAPGSLFTAETTLSFSTKFVAVCQKVHCSYTEFATEADRKFTIDRCYGKRYFVALYINEDDKYKAEVCFGVCQWLEGEIKVFIL